MLTLSPPISLQSPIEPFTAHPVAARYGGAQAAGSVRTAVLPQQLDGGTRVPLSYSLFFHPCLLPLSLSKSVSLYPNRKVSVRT